MPTITTQKQAREVQLLDFCFLCGGSFSDQSRDLRKTFDHLPQQAIFVASDKNFPLKVPAHWICNNDWSKKDEIVGELIAVLHGTKKAPKKSGLELGLSTDAITGDTIAGVSGSNLNLERHVIRWVRGFHAALYREFLPDQGPTNFCVSLPTPRLLSGPQAVPLMRNLLRNHVSFVEILKKNRLAGRLDRIHCNNGKFTYECVWTRADEGKECCVFAIKLYDSERLGPTSR